MRYRITAPNRAYNGMSAGVRFVAGVGCTDSDWLAGWFRERGYTVEELKGSAEPEAVETEEQPKKRGRK